MEIKIEDLTTKDLQGTGAFDNIMTAMETRLSREFNKNRLRGPDYAKVYLGTFEASLMNSIQYLLGRQEADKKAELLVEQTKHTTAQIALTKQQTLTEIENTTLTQEKIETENKQQIILGKQASKLDSEINLLVDQLLSESKKRVLMDAEIAFKQAQTAIAKEELKLKVQELLLRAEELLIAKQKLELTKVQIWTEKAKVTNDIAITKPPTIVSGLIGGQIRKIDNEGRLLDQKVVTERAQTRGYTHQNPPPPETILAPSGKEYIIPKPGTVFPFKGKNYIATNDGIYDGEDGWEWCELFPELCSEFPDYPGNPGHPNDPSDPGNPGDPGTSGGLIIVHISGTFREEEEIYFSASAGNNSVTGISWDFPSAAVLSTSGGNVAVKWPAGTQGMYLISLTATVDGVTSTVTKSVTIREEIPEVPIYPIPEYDPMSGVLGRQMDLYKKQTDGFDRDAEQKLSKIYVDAWNVQRGTDDNFGSCGSGLENMEIASILNQARQGIGIEGYTTPGDQVTEGIWKDHTFVDENDDPIFPIGQKPTCPVPIDDAKSALDLQEYRRVYLAELIAKRAPTP